MNPKRRSLLRCSLAVAVASLVASGAARAGDAPVKVAGVLFERQARVAGADLLLNGTGVRAVAWFKGYAAGLYLTAHAATADEVVAVPGPKRLQMRMLRDVPAVEFVKAQRLGMSRNVLAPALPQLAVRLDRFAALIEAVQTVHEGDLINLDYEPGRGLLFSLNGTLRGEAIAGEDFYAALLRAFVGERPYDERLKAGLLGHPS